MNTDSFWKIIDDARAEVGLHDQERMLECTEAKLAELPSSEIAEWFNIHHFYLDLADRKSVEKAASDCGIYLSDDSFLYFRGWLLSLGKDIFYSVLNEPETLAQYVTSAEETRFESFVYAGHEVYQDKAFSEEYGPEGMKNWRDNWFADNPDKGEHAYQWALNKKYNLWDASAKRPLSDETKEQIRNDLFAQSDSRGIPIVKRDDTPIAVEKVLLELMPPDSKNYRKLSMSLYSGYEWGFGMLPAASQYFHDEIGKLFAEADWERHEPVFAAGCPEYSKGKSRLYCHPLELSGPCDEKLIPEVCELMTKATSCAVTKAEDQGRVFDITDAQYIAALEILRSEIETDLLREFSLPNRKSDSDRHENVMMKYRIMTLDHHTDTLSSLRPYWKYTESVMKDLIDQRKIIKRPESNRFTSWNYITSSEQEIKRTSLDSKIQSASSQTCKPDSSESKKMSTHDQER